MSPDQQAARDAVPGDISKARVERVALILPRLRHAGAIEGEAAAMLRALAVRVSVLEAALREMLPENNMHPFDNGRPDVETCEAARAALAGVPRE